MILAISKLDQSSHRARGMVATLALAEALAQLIRDHDHPARVEIGRKRGTISIKTADLAGKHWQVCRLPCNRDAVRAWLGY